MYLVDTNIFLEGLLKREKSESVAKFFKEIEFEQIHITDLTLHSIGIILFKFKKEDLFTIFLEDTVLNGIKIVSLKTTDLMDLKKASIGYGLDFEDAYQYTAAKNFDLKIISFDSDFDKTKLGRIEPEEAYKTG